MMLKIIRNRMSKSRRDDTNIGVMLNLIQHPLFQGIAGQARNDGASKAPKSRRDDTLLTVGFNLRTGNAVHAPKSRRDDTLFAAFGGMMLHATIATAIMFIMVSCEESKRFEITGNDSTPPGIPVFTGSKPLPGGARIFFIPPPDDDVLGVEASYLNTAGKTVRFAASFTADSLDVLGFGSEGEHTIELCALDRSGNRSTSIRQTVEALEPPAATLAKSVNVLSSFASMLVKWENEATIPLYVWVDFAYALNGKYQEHTTVFNTIMTETRSVDSLKLFDGEPLSVKVSIGDKYGNIIAAKDTVIVLLTDEPIAKDQWRLLPAGTEMGGVLQVRGNNMEALIDGVLDVEDLNFFITTEANPWNIIIDLGDEYELSRIVTHQRWTGYNNTWGVVDEQGNLYRGDNVLSSILYIWDNQLWEPLLFRVIFPPVVKTESEYILLGMNGDMSFIYPLEPQFSKPTRYVRLQAINGKYISEITLYGRKVN